MTETVVHVTSFEEWKSVLDIWFEQGYSWYLGGQKYHEVYFNSGARYLFIDEDNDILKSLSNDEEPYIEYSEFIVKQREDNKMETYYVTQEQFALIEDIKNAGPFVSFELAFRAERFKELVKYFDESKDKALLRYLGGDETIKFKVKEKLYRLWRIDDDDEKVYMMFNVAGTPDWARGKSDAFTAPLAEIRNWQTPAWEIEEAD